MNKAEKMKKLALSVKELFKKNGSPDDKRVYRFCLDSIKTEAEKGKLECTFHINTRNYNNIDLKRIAAWLEKDGFEVVLAPSVFHEVLKAFDFIDDWEMKVSWE